MTEHTSLYPEQIDSAPTTTDAAKDAAAGLKDKAAGAGEHLLGEAKGEAAAVTQEARRQLADLWSLARTEVSGQAGTQQSRLAGGLASVGDQLTQMAAAPAERSLATDVARELGDRVTSLGRWLENHGPDDALDEVRSFARRRPGTFLVLAAGAGAVLGRLTRGLKDAPATSSTAATRAPSAEPTPVPPHAEPADRWQPPAEVATAAPSTAGWDPR